MKTILITAAIFLAAVGLAWAHGGAKNNFSGMMVGNEIGEMMNGNGMGAGIMGMRGMMMRDMMNGNDEMNEMMKNHHGENGMGCMEMMKNMDSLTKEEKEKMLADMDKDGDGICDMCGVPIGIVKKMMGL